MRLKKKIQKYSVTLKLDKIDWSKVEKIFYQDKQKYLYKYNKKQSISPGTKELIKILAGGAVIGLSMVFPALPMAVAPFIFPKDRYDNRYFNQSLNRLKKQKLVEIVTDENGNQLVKISQEGRIRALRYRLEEIRVKKPKKWDKKWRVVIFDIPEKYKRMREIFRKHLQIMGFYMLQKSVWVHPYQCFNEIEFLRQIYKVGIDVTYMVAEKIENPTDLKEQFKLR